MKNVLFIVYEFPPLNSGGSHRPFRFAKYLPQFGINPVIVTTEVENDKLDNSLLKELDSNIKVIRTPQEKPSKYDAFLSKNYINILDTDAKRWKTYLYPAIEQLVKEIKFDALYVTAPPFSVANLGVEISKKYNLPLILDMRDHWSHWNITPFTSYLHYRAILKTENNWFKNAAAVLAVSKEMVDDFKSIHADVESSKFYTVRNSFPKEIDNLPETIKIRKATEENPLKIGYVGSFYYNPYQRELIFKPWWKKKPYQWFQYSPRKEDWLYRSPYFFFKTLQELFNRHPELKKLIQVEFIGSKPFWLEEMIKEFNLSAQVSLKGFLPHKESLAFQQECDALLGTSMKVIGGRDYCIAGKSYEYIAQKKPILAFVTEGSQKDFFEESGMAVIFDADNTAENVEKLKNFILGKTVLNPNKEFMKKINSKFTTQQLANIIQKAALK